MEHLRVCWAGQQKDRNCGRRTKCVSTAICFTLKGGPVPIRYHRYPGFFRRLKKGIFARLQSKLNLLSL